MNFFKCIWNCVLGLTFLRVLGLLGSNHINRLDTAKVKKKKGFVIWILNNRFYGHSHYIRRGIVVGNLCEPPPPWWSFLLIFLLLFLSLCLSKLFFAFWSMWQKTWPTVTSSFSSLGWGWILLGSIQKCQERESGRLIWFKVPVPGSVKLKSVGHFHSVWTWLSATCCSCD